MATLPKTKVDDVLDFAIKTGVAAWIVRFVFRSNRV